MGMLMHNTWLEQQKKKAMPVKAEPAPSPAAEAEEEKPVKQTVKRTGTRRKTK